MNALVYVDIYINIGNFEGFLWNLNLSTNRFFEGVIYVVPIYISCTKKITLWESARAYIEYYIKEAGELGTKVLKLADSNCHLEN